MDNKPAPLPYHVGLLAINIGVVEIGDANARRVATLNSLDIKNPFPTAKFVVKAANCHDVLVDALEEALEAMLNLCPAARERQCVCHPNGDTCTFCKVKKALQQAKE